MTGLRLFFLSVLCFSCLNQNEQYEKFYRDTFNIVRENSIQRDVLNWDKLDQDIRDSIISFDNNIQVFQGISYLTSLLEDGHSIFSFPEQLTLLDTIIPMPSIYTTRQDGIGYLKIAGYIANDSLSRIYSNDIRENLIQLYSHDLKGWIIDLRENAGGKHGMLHLGLAPLYKESIVGYTFKNDNQIIEHKCTEDQFYIGEDLIASSSSYNHNLNNEKPIAILISENTVSDAEFLSSSFSVLPNARLFGRPTSGKTTLLTHISFTSGARLLLATQQMCDSTKNPISSVKPDVQCADLNSCMILATEWIENSPN